MSKHRAKRKGIEFKLDPGAKQLFRTFFTVMIIGGLFCLSCFGNGHWELIFGYMLTASGQADFNTLKGMLGVSDGNTGSNNTRLYCSVLQTIPTVINNC